MRNQSKKQKGGDSETMSTKSVSVSEKKQEKKGRDCTIP